MKRLVCLAATVAIAMIAGTAFAQQTAFYQAPVGAIGQMAYKNDKFKILPSGYHDFVPIKVDDGAFVTVADAFCHKWEKMISVQKRIRLIVIENSVRFPDDRASPEQIVRGAVDWVNRDNGIAADNPKKVCWYGTHNVRLDEAATRGYDDENKQLQPVRIIRMRATNGMTIYGGYHL